MNARITSFYRLFFIAAVFCMVLISSILITGQPALKHRVGVPDDWSHRHLIFSNPGTYAQAIAHGTYSHWIKLQYDTRFLLQQMKRNSGVRLPVEGASGAVSLAARKPGVKEDWSQALTHSTFYGTVQPNTYPAKWGASSTAASCTGDYVVYPTGYVGSATSATLIADHNLYTTGCSGTVPSIYWAYNTGATISTSPIISLDGSQVAFIQSNGTTASLVLLKWQPSQTVPTGIRGTTVSGSKTVTITTGSVTQAYAGMQISGGGIPTNDTIASATGSTVTLATAATATHATAEAIALHAETVALPGVAPAVANSAYHACTAPCMTTLAFATSTPNDTFSSPFYDYSASDALYVGDDSGNLHKFTGVFSGTPAEAGSPWPVKLSASKLGSPVADPTSGNVFVGDMGGILHSVSAATGTVIGTSSSLGDAIIDSPLVDPSLETVYAFVTTNSGGSNAVYQFPATFTTGSGNGSVTVGTGGTGYYFYAGNFDNVYYQSSTPAGNLWVVGNTGATAGPGKLYRIPITSGGGMGTPVVAVATLTEAEPPWPSPLGEFCNNGSSPCTTNGTTTTAGADYLFFSVNEGAGTGCTHASTDGCVLSYNVTNPASPTQSGNGLNVKDPAAPGCWATGGMVIDNSDVTTTGASQIYFINLNENSAGGPTIGTNTSSHCTSGTTRAIDSTQASQSSP